MLLRMQFFTINKNSGTPLLHLTLMFEYQMSVDVYNTVFKIDYS